MTISDIMWVEKYRPKKISEVVNQKDIKGSLQALLKNQQEMPHLLFSGSAGVGKTTMAICISQEILGDRWKDYTLELNASDERGIGMVRERVKKFSRFAGLDTEIPFKIIILDEADEMTSDAQTALRRIIEDTAKFCRFILIANNISKIINPIQSRCAVFKFSQIDEKEITAQLKVVLKKENGKADEKGLKEIAEYAEGDLRHAINLLQTAASMGDITQDSVKAAAGLTKINDVEEVLKLAVSGNIQDSRNKMIELVKVYGMSESDFLKYINQALFSAKFDNLEELSQIIAKYDYRILVGSNPEIQLSAMLAELGKFSK
ncbi:MAG: replication factor C small subunit [Candidatus Nitrosopelagicus sp.]|jgi:replication factor C small subunit|nr:replication factor C small subunit [Candidatus Nitrosopelagicus sp.]MBT4455190.1 replication factor C small subunit [Candidatus Nitrosopelagicus sp.]MBT5171221.1 replication factor C small subunit [Candidatus Nitrosopelagicus sp.]MBT6646177.1 replication factor C small subunit [Nitrososphaerota archaeon]MBT7252750.1 replication factor C small subunit [Candidatus Nitrosopelagicus sp.]|tara:strand:+ start:1991 stop:2947 length:957 start_codon:yes stop_codon:yes gene_type:complete